MQKIICRGGRCKELKGSYDFVQRSDIVGQIENDLLKSELGDSDDE